MRTLLVPCLGHVLYDGVPNYLWHCASGEVLLARALHGVHFEKFDRIVLSMLAGELEQFEPLGRLPEDLRTRIEICCFEKQTSSVAETVFQTIQRMKITGNLVIKDCDSYFQMEDSDGNFVAGIDVCDYPWELAGLKKKSFLRVNEQGNIIDIIEKHLRTDIISVGGYGFEDASDFLFAYQRLKDKAYGIDKLYVSHVIAYLIGEEENVFSYVPALEYEDYGSQEEALAWRQRSKIKRRLAIFDLDGTLFDTTEVNYRAYKEALGADGREFTYATYRDECNGHNYKEFLPHYLEDEAKMEEVHQKKIGLYEQYLPYARPHKHLLTILRLMSREYHIAVVTTASRQNAEELLDSHQIMSFVELLVTQDDVKHLKPATDGLEMAMHYFNIDAKHTLVFEDSKPGLIAAHDSGADYLKVYNYN